MLFFQLILQKILDYGKRYKKLNTPFLRPSKLAKDRTETFPVIEHAMIFMEKLKKLNMIIYFFYSQHVH